jgi:hypothetical protein
MEEAGLMVRRLQPAVSGQTGWPIGFWWAELTIRTGSSPSTDTRSTSPAPTAARCAPTPGATRDESGYFPEDLLSLRFITSAPHAALGQMSIALADADLDPCDASFLVGGQGPMYTFYDDARRHDLAVRCCAPARSPLWSATPRACGKLPTPRTRHLARTGMTRRPAPMPRQLRPPPPLPGSDGGSDASTSPASSSAPSAHLDDTAPRLAGHPAGTNPTTAMTRTARTIAEGPPFSYALTGWGTALLLVLEQIAL